MNFVGYREKLRLSGFSLVEVVIATGIFAAAIVAVVGLMSPMTKRADDVIDSEIAARLSESIQSELERVGYQVADELPATILLYANASGRTVRLASGTETPLPVDRSLDDPVYPGIAERERHFQITLHQLTKSVSAITWRADVEWPFWVPDGPADPTSRTVVSGHIEVPENQRQRLSYFFALRR